jgi:hypothetical protein
MMLGLSAFHSLFGSLPHVELYRYQPGMVDEAFLPDSRVTTYSWSETI